MKRILPILLVISVLCSVFIVPTNASAKTYDEIKPATAKAIEAGKNDYNEKDLSFTSLDESIVYKITVDTTGVYSFFTTTSEKAAVEGYLYRANNIKPDEYIKYSSLQKINGSDELCELYYYLKKGEAVYLKLNMVYNARDEYLNRKFELNVLRMADCYANDGVLYRPIENGYEVFDNYISKNQGVTILNEVNNKPVTSIGVKSFENCKYITSLKTSENLKYINSYAFNNCVNLKNISFANGLQSISPGYTFDDTEVESLHLPKSVKSFYANCGFQNLKSISVDKNNEIYTAENGVLFSKDKKTLVMYPKRKGTSYTIPNGVESIGSNAFSETILESVTFPNTLEVVDYGAFRNSRNLSDVKLNSGLRILSGNAFSNCYSIVYLKLPETIEDISHNAFQNCELRSIVIPKNCKYVNYEVFSGCYRLESVVVEGKDTSFQNRVFEQCKVKNIYAPKGSKVENLLNTVESYKNINFIPTDLETGKECTSHKFVVDECVKKPDCTHYGIYTTKCAICKKTGPNQKVTSNEHCYLLTDICTFCKTPSKRNIYATLNSKYDGLVDYQIDRYSSANLCVYVTPSKDGKYKFNINSISDKVILYISMQSAFTNNFRQNVFITDKKSSITFNLKKNEQLCIDIKPLSDATYYEPIKVDFGVTCDHIYKNTVVKPTYVSEGYTLHKCTTCDYSYKDKKTAKLKLQTPSNLKLNSGKKSLIVSYKKVTKATGYQIQYSLKSNFKSAKIIKINKNTTTKTTIKKLSSNKKYYVRVRSYVVQNKKTAYSSWSKSSNAKVK